MANLQINSAPPLVGLIGEGLKYEIERINLPSFGVAECFFTLPSIQGAYTGNIMSINTYEGIFEYVLSENPDESGLQLRTWNDADNYSDFLNKVCDDLAAHYALSKHYLIRVTSQGFRLTARNIGNAYNVNLHETSVDDLTEGTNTSGVDDPTPSDYKIYVAVMLHDDATEAINVPAGEDLLDINSSNIANADMAEYMSLKLTSSFTYPYQGIIVSKVPDAVKKYYIRYGEYKNGDVQKIYNTVGVSKYAIAGNLKQIDSDFLSNIDSDFFSFIGNCFLTWQPHTKVTYPTAPERLYFLITSGNCTLMLTTFYSDDTSVTIEKHTFNDDTYFVTEILCGVPELYIGEDVSNIEKYEIWIKNDKGDNVSEIRTFIVDHSSYLNIRTFIFRNSFNMFDIVNCTGALEVTDSIKRTEMEVLDNEQFRRRILISENSPAYKLNTGWLLTKETRNWLEDLLLTKHSWLAIDDFILPVVLTTGKSKRFEDREDNYSLSISFEPDYNNQYYSEIRSFEQPEEEGYFLLDENGTPLLDADGIGLVPS